MAPDANQRRLVKAPSPPSTNESLECILQSVSSRRVLQDFSYVEQPVRCLLEHEKGRYLACNGKSAWYMLYSDEKNNDSSPIQNELVLLPQPDGSVLLQSAKTRHYLCADLDSGSVYASCQRHDDDDDSGDKKNSNGSECKWIVTESCNAKGKKGYRIESMASRRHLTCTSNVVGTVERNNDNDKNSLLWHFHMTSGELCFLSLTGLDMRARCDLFGTLSLSKRYQGWEAWRFSHVAGHAGGVRISPWAHSEKLLSSTNEGTVCTTEEQGENEIWLVEKAPKGHRGVIIQSARHGTVLRYDNKESRFRTTTSSLLDEYCIWDLESLHRHIYYVVTADSGRKLEANKRGIATRGLPIRLSSEEWKIVPFSDNPGVVTLFSIAREQYLSCSDIGEVSLCTDVALDGSAEWVIEERENGFVIFSLKSRRVLVVPDEGPVTTIPPGVVGSTRWQLKPKLPRQVSKEKMQAVGTAVAIGVAGTVATPFLIGGAIGVLGVAHVSLVGEIAIGSIRAAEAIHTISRVTMSSSQLMISESSCHSTESESERGDMQNRRFSNWQSW